jgi:hypothetical protein
MDCGVGIAGKEAAADCPAAKSADKAMLVRVGCGDCICVCIGYCSGFKGGCSSCGCSSARAL